MHAPISNNRIAGYFGDLDSHSLRAEIKTLRDLVKVLVPITEMFSGFMSSTMGAARSSASSMLVPLMMMLASDVVNNPASHMGGNQGASHSRVDTLRGMRQGIERIENEAAEVLREGGNFNVEKRTPPIAKTAIQTIESVEEASRVAQLNEARVKTEARVQLGQVAEKLGVTVTDKANSKSNSKEIEAQIQGRIKELDKDVMTTGLRVVKERARLKHPGSAWAKTDAHIAEREAKIIRNTVQALYEKSKKDRDLKNFDLSKAEDTGRHLATLEREIGTNKHNQKSWNPTRLGERKFQEAAEAAEHRQEALLGRLGLTQTMKDLRHS